MHNVRANAVGGGLAALCVGWFGAASDLVVLMLSKVWNAVSLGMALERVMSDSPLMPVLAVAGGCFCGLALIGAALGAGAGALLTGFSQKENRTA